MPALGTLAGLPAAATIKSIDSPSINAFPETGRA